MKITILTQYYPPEHGAPQNRLHDLARRWVQAGQDVTVLTAMPNYPRGEVFEEYRGKFSMREEIDGVKVIRSWILASKKKDTISQLMAYFSFVFSSLVVGFLKLNKCDYLICESPPLFIGFTAVILKYITRSKLVMNISDLWPESAVQLGMIGPGIALSCLEWFEKFLYQESKVVTCQTEGIVAGVKKRFPRAQTLLYPNGVDLDMFGREDADDGLRQKLELPKDVFVVGYGGNHGRSQALSQVLSAAEKLRDEQIVFALFGDGPEKNELMAAAKEKGLEKVRFFPSQPRQEMSRVQALWDIALVPLKNIELFDGARPSKMFELMAGEIPFIFCGKGEGADIAVASGACKVVPPEDAEKLAETIKEFAGLAKTERQEMGRTARAFVEKDYNREKLAQMLLSELEGKPS